MHLSWSTVERLSYTSSLSYCEHYRFSPAVSQASPYWRSKHSRSIQTSFGTEKESHQWRREIKHYFLLQMQNTHANHGWVLPWFTPRQSRKHSEREVATDTRSSNHFPMIFHPRTVRARLRHSPFPTFTYHGNTCILNKNFTYLFFLCLVSV